MIGTDNEEDTENERNDEEIADAEETCRWWGLNIPVMRTNFTLKFKLKAINYFKSDQINYNKNKAQKHSKSDLGLHLGQYVSRQLFQNWLKQESELLKLKDEVDQFFNKT